MKNTNNELIEITKSLLSFPTVSPEGNEYLCQKYLEGKLTEIGMKVKVIAKDKKRPNIIGEYGKGKKSLVIACHMDVVDPGPDWKTDPFNPVVKNGKIYGRGAIDDKGPFAISIVAVRQFIQMNREFKGKIYLVALADEEADNIYGVKYLIKNGFKADAGLIPDGGYFNKLDIGEKGTLQIKIESIGKAAHSALHENGNSAVTNLTSLVEKIKNYKWPSTFDKKFTPTSVNVSKFHGGETMNVVAPYAYAQMDIRYPMGISSDFVLKTVNSLIKNTKGKFKTEIVYKTDPHLVKDDSLINAFLSASKKAKVKMETITLAGNSVAKEFNEAGIPSITHYPMNVLPIHEPNEYIEIEYMEKTKDLYVEFLKEYFK